MEDSGRSVVQAGRVILVACICMYSFIRYFSSLDVYVVQGGTVSVNLELPDVGGLMQSGSIL